MGSSGTTQPIAGMRWTGASHVGISGSAFSTQIINDTANSNAFEMYTTGSSPLVFGTAATQRMRIDSSGRLSINTTSASELLNIANTSGNGAGVEFAGNGNTIGSTSAFYGQGSGSDAYVWNRANSTVLFGTNNNERARFDVSGNFLVGKTSASGGIAGSVLAANGLTRLTASGIAVAEINRLTSDGSIVDFKKDGTTVGSVACRSSGGNLQIHTNQSGIDFGGDGYLPMRGSTITDNNLDIGSSSYRYDDIYATNGTIQTSDRNEKQDIEALSDAEQRVALAAKGLLRKFRWISSVEENGDDARIHFGIIAQDLQDEFTAEGLDAGRYAMFISSTWTDEETGEERTRLGVRYSELLAFIISAI